MCRQFSGGRSEGAVHAGAKCDVDEDFSISTHQVHRASVAGILPGSSKGETCVLWKDAS